MLVTGFFIPRGDPPAAETDGPPGTLLLAQALEAAGIQTRIVTDRYCWNAVVAAAIASEFSLERLICYPHPPETACRLAEGAGHRELDAPARAWRQQFFADCPRLTHLIAVERVGPCHTLESLLQQPQRLAHSRKRFESLVTPDQRDHCHNMRGEAIDTYAGDLHRLFEEVLETHPFVRTIGIGDGANEIGMGAVPWGDLERRLSGEQSGRVPCRVPCHWNIVAGTSNWGACALAAAVMHLRGQAALLRPFTAAQQLRVLEEMVANGPAVDGVTGRRKPTVDGLPFLTYIQPWMGMRRILELPD